MEIPLLCSGFLEENYVRDGGILPYFPQTAALAAPRGLRFPELRM